MSAVIMTFPWEYLDDASIKWFALVNRNTLAVSEDFQPHPDISKQTLPIQKDTVKLGYEPSGSPSGIR